MNGLAVKEINFDGATIKAAQDINNIIWVGVAWICNGIGMNKNMKDRQVKNIQEDSLLKQGCVKFDAGVFDPNNSTLALKLDYLPAWLFKINVTPKMELEMPDLANKIRVYQFRAKDVLAEAFLHNNEVAEYKPANTIQVQFPDYTDQFASINQSINRLYTDMGKLANIILSWQQNNEKQLQGIDEFSEWKRSMFAMMDKLVLSGKFANRAKVENYIYNYMTRNYGIVWNQEVKDYISANNCENRPNYLDIVYSNDTYRSIFDAVLSDMVANNCVSKINADDIDMIIAPLIKKYDDHSNAGMYTYKIVYSYMQNNYNVCWKNLETRYINRYGVKTLSKKNIINTNSTLLKKFTKSINNLLEE